MEGHRFVDSKGKNPIAVAQGNDLTIARLLITRLAFFDDKFDESS